MKTLQNFDTLQKIARFNVQAIGRVLTVGLVVVLLLAWALTGPLFQLSERIAYGRKLKTETK
jgi:low affinity Fe/Cu permease